MKKHRSSRLGSKSFQTLGKTKNFNVISAITVVALAGVAGYFILATRAAGSFVATEAESATRSGNVALVADTNASAGQAIKFGTTVTSALPQNITPPTVNSIPSIVVDPTNPRILYVGTDAQGLWKSTDQGSTWAKINTGAGGDLLELGQGEMWTLAIDPFNHNTLWTTSGYGAGGPLRSTDGGVSWTMLPAGTPTQNNDVYSIALDPYTPNHVLVEWHSPWTTGDAGVSESVDNGATWVNHQPPTGSGWGAGNTAWFLDTSHTWLLGSQNGGIWRTTNSGSTWTQVNTTNITHGGIYALSTIGGKLYLAVGTTVLVSNDDGVTWANITSGLPFAWYETILNDGTNLYTAPSFPTSNYIDGPWYVRPIAGGSWTQLAGPHTCNNGSCDGPFMGAYDAVNHVAYGANGVGGVWKLQGAP